MAGLWRAPPRLGVNTRALLSAPPYLPAVSMSHTHRKMSHRWWSRYPASETDRKLGIILKEGDI